jgi:hypothetical protein
MIKTEEYNTEFFVVTRPNHREQQPDCYRGYAKDAERAADAVPCVSKAKETLEILEAVDCPKFTWDKETIAHYWEMYGNPSEVRIGEIRLF